jgi:hypothetical protein
MHLWLLIGHLDGLEIRGLVASQHLVYPEDFQEASFDEAEFPLVYLIALPAHPPQPGGLPCLVKVLVEVVVLVVLQVLQALCES